MTFWLLSSLLVLAQAAPAQDAPIAAAPSQTPPAVTGASLAPPGLEGAPKDDFGRVAWCHGLLSGHMALARHIASVQPLNAEKQQVGLSYLNTFVGALAASPEGAAPDAQARAQQLRQAGYDRWKPARLANLDAAADLYAAFRLPAECNAAAAKLAPKSVELRGEVKSKP